MAERHIDAAVYSHRKKRGFFFEGAKYYRYKSDSRVDTGYPKPIKSNWKKLPAGFAEGIRAAVHKESRSSALVAARS